MKNKLQLICDFLIAALLSAMVLACICMSIFNSDKPIITGNHIKINKILTN